MAKRNPFQYNRAQERQFQAALMKVAHVIRDIIRRSKTPDEVVARLEAFAATPAYKAWSQAKARNMTHSVLVANAKTWREAVRKGTKAEKIYRLLSRDFAENKIFQGMIQNNAQWISTLPLSTAEEITKHAAKAALEGKRTADIMAEINKRGPKLAPYKVKRIARTEVAKANATITEIRSQEAGLDWYVWRTVNDQRVRTAHDEMEGVLCQFSSPPCPEQLAQVKGDHSFYNPGGIYNCRCFSAPVILLDEVQWPAKVHINGRIVRMTRREFEKLF